MGFFLINRLVSKKVENSGAQKQLEVLQQFRTYQVLTIFINEFCQFSFLPSMQIGGAGIVIVGLYTATVSHGKLPLMLYLSSVFLAIFVAIFIYVVLEVASKVMLKSKAFTASTHKWTTCYTNGDRAQARIVKRYIRSLTPAKIYMGPFHVVDKSRGPALLRFCLQRTTFLIVKGRA